MASHSESTANDIAHVVNKDKKYLSEHGQKLFNAINILLDDQEQLELTQALFKYQSEHNVFTLVRSCRELFDTTRKKSLMLFMRPVIPVKDRFHYDEYYKLFFPEEFPGDVKSIFKDLIPQELIDKTLQRAIERNKQKLTALEQERDKEQEKRVQAIKMLEQVNHDLNMDIQRLMAKASLNDSSLEKDLDDLRQKASLFADMGEATLVGDSISSSSVVSTSSDVPEARREPVKIAGFRIIDLEPDENESLGFDICMGPTNTFIMVSYVEPDSQVAKYGMKVGDELVSVNDISFKMMELDQAIDILSSEARLRLVLQTSGFLPDPPNQNLASNSSASQFSDSTNASEVFNNEWLDTFNNQSSPPAESKSSLKKHIRRIVLRPDKNDTSLGISIRGGFEFGLGIFIAHIEPNSLADLCGLKKCDQIIEVNGQKFSRILHQDAVVILQNSLITYRATSLPIKITVRYLSKLPVLSQVKCDTSISLSDAQSKIELNDKLVGELFATSKPGQVALFKYYLSEYLENRTNIKYFLYLVFNRLKINKKILSKSVEFEKLIKPSDLKVFQTIVDETRTDGQESGIRYLTDDFKNALIIRSTEAVNDLNINPIRKFNKFDGFSLIKTKRPLCISLDCLNYVLDG